MKYYLCIKEKECKQVNWFINYTFYSGSASACTDNRIMYGAEFNLGQIYTNRNEEFREVVYDNHGTAHKVDDVREFLEDFDFVLDEEVNKIMERKGDKFHVDITPLSKRNGNVNYMITCRYTNMDGVTYYTQNINVSQYEGVIFGLKMMRKSDRITNLWRDVVRYHKNKIR